MDNGMIMFLKPTVEERVILRNTYDYFQQRIRGHSDYYKDGMIYKSEEIFGCVVELTRITFGVPHLIKLNKDDKQRADSFARALVARYLNLVEDCIASKEVPILCISGEAVRKKE